MKNMRLFWPLVFTLPGVVILLVLGTWQLERLAWKEALIAEREAGLSAPPIALPQDAEAAGQMNFRRVSIFGQYLKGLDFQLQNRNRGGKRGVDILSAFQRASTEGGAIVLLNRGWVPLDELSSLAGLPGQTDPVTVRGVVRTGATGRNTFTPVNDPAKSIWYSVDPAAMANSRGLTAWPLVIEIDAPSKPGVFPAPGLSHYELKNNHLFYALTWYVLAAGLAVIFTLFLRQRLRDQP